MVEFIKNQARTAELYNKYHFKLYSMIPLIRSKEQRIDIYDIGFEMRNLRIILLINIYLTKVK